MLCGLADTQHTNIWGPLPLVKENLLAYQARIERRPRLMPTQTLDSTCWDYVGTVVLWLLNDTLTLFQFAFSVLLWCSALRHHYTRDVKSWAKRQGNNPSLCFGILDGHVGVVLPCVLFAGSLRTGQTLQRCGRLAFLHLHQSSKLKMACNAHVGLSS